MVGFTKSVASTATTLAPVTRTSPRQWRQPRGASPGWTGVSPDENESSHCSVSAGRPRPTAYSSLQMTSSFFSSSTDRMGAVPTTRPSTSRTSAYSASCPMARVVDVDVEDDAVAGRGIGAPLLHGVEDGVARALGGHDRAEAAPLRERVAVGGGVAGVRQVVVRGGDEPHPVAVRQVLPDEPVEGAVHRHHLDEGLELGVRLAVVAGVVGVRDDEDVVGVVARVQALVELGQGGELDGRHRRPVGGVAVEHVVVAAEPGRPRPLPAEIGDEPPGVVERLHRRSSTAPTPRRRARRRARSG